MIVYNCMQYLNHIDALGIVSLIELSTTFCKLFCRLLMTFNFQSILILIKMQHFDIHITGFNNFTSVLHQIILGGNLQTVLM